MLILTKSIFSIILGLIFSILFGYIILSIFKKKNFAQSVSRFLNERHLRKDGTPTMGGLIFIIPTLLIITILLLLHKISINNNLILILFIFISYMILGLIDDLQKVLFKNNKGISILEKFSIQIIIALIFFVVFIINGNNTIISFFNISIDLKFFYGIFILFLLAGCSNAVNITDGLDGLCGGCMIICLITYGIIAWNKSYIIGNEEIAIFCFTLSGALLGFLFFNFYPAKIFMGDLGSLALGSVLASIAIILKLELSLAIIGIVFIIETISSFIQIISIRYFHKKILKKSPLHHHFEELGYEEVNIIKIFYTFNIIFCLIALLYYVWN